MEPTSIPDECLLQVFMNLNPNEIVRNVSQVCTRWNNLSKDEILWKVFCNQHCLVPQTAPLSYFRCFIEDGIIKEEPFFQAKKKKNKYHNHTDIIPTHLLVQGGLLYGALSTREIQCFDIQTRKFVKKYDVELQFNHPITNMVIKENTKSEAKIMVHKGSSSDGAPRRIQRCFLQVLGNRVLSSSIVNAPLSFSSDFPGNFPPKTAFYSRLDSNIPSIIWKIQNKLDVAEKIFEFDLEGPGVLQEGETITAGYITENHLITGSSFLFSPNTLPFLRLWDIN